MVKVFFKRAAHLLTAFFAGGVCVLQAAETSGFGIDLGNGSGTAQEGWTNVTMPATASGGANTFVAVPLIRNGAASSSSSVAVGSLFGRLVSLTVSARCSSGGSYTLAEPNTRYTWYEGGKHRHSGTNADAPSSFEFPNGAPTGCRPPPPRPGFPFPDSRQARNIRYLSFAGTMRLIMNP